MVLETLLIIPKSSNHIHPSRGLVLKIFLGYASENLVIAREIYSFLKTINEDIWFDKESLVGGDDWDRERSSAQQNANFVIHLISSEIFSRPGVVNREIKQTLKLVEDQPIGSSYVLFIRIDDVRMPAELIRFQYIDYFGPSWRDQLAQAVTKRLGQLGGSTSRIASEKTTTVTTNPNNVVDTNKSSHVESSVSTEYFQVSADYLQYSGGDVYWDFVNAKLASEALGGFVYAAADFRLMNDHDRERAREYNTPFEWGIKMQEFFRRKNFLSIRSSIYWYSGGVHPNYGITTLNFLGPDYGQCTIKDLLGYNDENVARLLAYCKKVLLAMFDNESEAEENYIAEMLDNPNHSWKLASHFNIDDRGLTMNFSPYDVLPFVFGSHEVFVPWRVVTPLLAQKYERLEDQLSNLPSG